MKPNFHCGCDLRGSHWIASVIETLHFEDIGYWNVLLQYFPKNTEGCCCPYVCVLAICSAG